MATQFLNPDGLSAATYSHVAVVKGGQTVYISGQVSANEKGELVGDTFEAQTRQVFANLQTALAAAGAGLEHLAKLTTFVVGLDAEKVTIFRTVRGELFGDYRPTSTLVDTGALAGPGFMIEIEAIAVID